MSKRKPNNTRARLERASRALLRTNHVGVINIDPHGGKGLIHMQTAKKIVCGGALVTAINDIPHQWTIYLSAFCIDQRGERYIKSVEIATPGMPWRLAFALQDDGWYLRQDIIWHKPNPMPESTRDRCTKAHEYLFLLSKSRRYHYDSDAIREPASYGPTPTGVGFGHGTDAKDRNRGRVSVPKGWDTSTGEGGHGSYHKDGAARAARDSFKREGSKREQVIPGQSKGTHRPDRAESSHDLQTRNKRSVWTVATHGFKGAHFATFPPDLIRPCILAGAPRGGLVLDPFGGAGTTALVAMQEGRRSVLCELNPEYAALARARLDAAWLDGAAQMDLIHDTPAA